ncbi:YbaK/EbsC family protein [Vibrio sp. JC009]|uniref:aminoacyl-tRNA deacylase n=1 Tax=Vibrio sp. JC009 TaxID=2912314 RepID=UPI0023B0C99F|nr:YbaK/EbsC family protein [Vibrio sp. JC009]WED24320.1 YbaK/EbsC family protein [Vibrio sp. JC009]
MAVSDRIDRYMGEHHISYQTLTHRHSNSSLHSAFVASIPPMSLAKAVVLEDHEGRHLMAVLPSNSKISLSVLNEAYNATYHLVKEQEVYKLFEDCDRGAVPPIGSAYHMSVVCDEHLAQLDNVYLESGDHETLIKLDNQAFRKLMTHCRYLRFSSEVFH